MPYNKKLTIGLFGFGTVGEGIYKVLQQTPTLQASIKKIAIKHAHKVRQAPAKLFTTNPNDLLNDPDINVIVELIDDADASFAIVSTALKNGKAVVSANKKMIAHHLPTLLELQAQYQVPFLYEAAVCGSIPIIRNLEEYYDNDLLNSVTGIVNGSTNFILTQMIEGGLSYETALLQAQELGFAESNPALDVEGKDAVNKLSIILHHAYGVAVHPDQILHKGITRLHPQDTRYATEKGYQIKLLAKAKRIGEQELKAFVLPSFVDANSQFYNVKNEYNGVLIGSKLADEQFLYGKGAGRYPTSSAVLSDIAALRYDYRYEHKKTYGGTTYALNEHSQVRIYVSYNRNEIVETNDFVAIEETYQSHERSYLVGIIELDKLKNAYWLEQEGVSVVSLDEIKLSQTALSPTLNNTALALNAGWDF